MHTTEGITKGITFHHDGDYDGEVIINISKDATWEYKRDLAVEYTPRDVGLKTPGFWTVRIPFEDLKRLVAYYVVTKKISALEEASDDELLCS